MTPYKRSHDGEFIFPTVGPVRTYNMMAQTGKRSNKQKLKTIGGIKLPQNWVDLCIKFSDPKGMNQFKALYKGYRTRQILQEWIAARYMNPEIDREVLWERLRLENL